MFNKRTLSASAKTGSALCILPAANSIWREDITLSVSPNVQYTDTVVVCTLVEQCSVQCLKPLPPIPC